MAHEVRWYPGWFIAGLMVAQVVATGCTTISPAGQGLLATADRQPAATSQGSVVVEIRSGKKPHIVEVPFQPEMHVQDAVQQSRALRKMRRMEIVVVRTTPDGRRQKLESRLDPATRRVPPQFDYLLYPGDHVIVSHDPTGPFEKMFENTMGPLARLARADGSH